MSVTRESVEGAGAAVDGARSAQATRPIIFKHAGDVARRQGQPSGAYPWQWRRPRGSQSGSNPGTLGWFRAAGCGSEPTYLRDEAAIAEARRVQVSA